MVWAIVIQLAIYAGVTIISALINKGSKSANQGPGEPIFPKADSQAPIPVIYGTTRVGMNVVYKARVTKGENTVRDSAMPFGFSATHIGYFFYLDLLATIGWGPVDCLHDIIVDGTKSLAALADQPLPVFPDVSTGFQFPTQPAVIDLTGSLGTINALPKYMANVGPVDFTITAGEILGGKLSRGGIGAGSFDAASTGLMRFYQGNGFSVANSELEALAGTTLPRYPNLCTVAFLDNFYFGNQPQLPGVEFIVSRAPSWAPGAGTGYIGNVTANAGTGANPAFVLWDLLTNTDYGLALPPDDLNSGSFAALSHAVDQGLDVSADFNVPVSFVLTEQTTGKSVVEDLLRTLDGVLYTDPETGLLNVRLLRAPSAPHYGYDSGDVVTIGEDVIRSLEWTDSAPDAQANEVTVEFIDASRHYTKNTVVARNVAAIQALGRVEARTVSFLGVQDGSLAMRLAQRELRSLSTSLGHATIECDRTGYVLTPGQFFTLTWSPRSISARIMRVVEVRDAANGGVTIEAVEDVYSSPAASFVVETTPEPTPVPNYDYILPRVEPSWGLFAAVAIETLTIYDPQGHVTAIEFSESNTRIAGGAAWHVAYNDAGTVNTVTPYINYVGRESFNIDTIAAWRVGFTAQDGSTEYFYGEFPNVVGLQPIEAPMLSWTVSAGIVTVTATFDDAWSSAAGPDVYMGHSQVDFPTFNYIDDIPLGKVPPLSISFPYPAAGQVEYVSALRLFSPSSGTSGQSEYSHLTIVGDSATTAAVGTTLGQIGIAVELMGVPENDQWLALSTIPDAETEVGTEYRQQSYAVGVGSVRVGANIKTLTGTPTIGGAYSLDGFGSTVALTSFAPSGTGVRYSGWAPMPSAAQDDIGVTWTVANGADTAALDLYRVWLEYLPTTVSGVREHSDEHAPEYS